MKYTIFLAALGLMTLIAAPARAADQPATAVVAFAGGCFWCMQEPFQKLDGVVSAYSGYTGGSVPNPTYEQVSSGRTGHAEAVQVVYDPTKVTFEKLLYTFWRNVDPLDKGGQFCDRGSQYRTGIFVSTDAQKAEAIASKKSLDEAKKLSAPIVTEIAQLGIFTKAEAYHQDYYKTHAYQYAGYRYGCGRDARLDALWGKEARGGVGTH